MSEWLASIVTHAGGWSYALLFLIIFCETGLVITPFLPGDSLLFAAGAFAAIGSFNIWLLLALLIIAATLGDTVNYWIGHALGMKIFSSKHLRFLKPHHLERTKKFFDRYGAKAIFLSRFIPIVRTLTPFIAGVGAMSYRKFIIYNIFGGVIWVSLFLLGGYLFGNLSIVKHNFSLVIILIVLISILPSVVEYLRMKSEEVK